MLKVNSPTAVAVWPRVLMVAGVVGLLLSAEHRDNLAAIVGLTAACGLLVALQHRTRTTARRALVLVIGGVMLGATVTSITLPTLKSRPQPFVELTSAGADPGSGSPGVGVVSPPSVDGNGEADLPPGPGASWPRAEVLGFATADFSETTAGIDRSVAGLSTLAVGGLSLGSDPGTLVNSVPPEALERAHLEGDEALITLDNFDGAEFSAARAGDLLGSGSGAEAARVGLANGLAALVSDGGWDGVVLDLEALPLGARAGYVQLVQTVKAALGPRRVVVALPASDDPYDLYIAPYDLAALGAAADQVVWMAYDHHYPTGPPGPIADLSWVRASLDVAQRAIPAEKILLGVAAYGYAWPRGAGAAETLSVDQAREAASQPGARLSWDAASSEWHGRDPAGREIWFADSRAAVERADLATRLHLGGVAVWRIGSEDRDLIASLHRGGCTAHKRGRTRSNRLVTHTSARGVVALTFDDGPDPRWTPAILDILAAEGVPGTFFVVGRNAEVYQDLVRREAAGGNVVGNHTYTHPNMTRVSSRRSQLEISADQVAIEGIIGERPLLFRSPYGEGDKVGTRPGADALAVRMGLHPTGWNVDSQDWTNPGVDQIVHRVVDEARSRSIVLLHDGGGDRAETVAALPRIIRELRARGYEFTTITGLDASLDSPYAPRRGWRSEVRGFGLIAAFQLQHAARDLLRWLIVAIAVLSIAKLLLIAPGAVVHWRRARRRRPETGGPWRGPPEVPVTVLVPAFNEAKVIATTIRAIARCHPRPAEVIVLDDGSTDGTAAVARAASEDLGGSLRVLSFPNQGKARALNRGMIEAANDLVVVIDADTVVDPAMIGAITAPFADPAVGAVAGNVKVGNRRRFLGALQALEYVVAINWDRRSQDTMNIMAVVPGAAGAFRRRAVLGAGGYPHDTLVEDADLTVTLLRQGWQIRFEESAVAWTEAPQRVADVVRQRRRWSFGTMEVVAKHAHAMLDARAGPVGLIGLPTMMITQVALPTLGPLADLYLLGLVLFGHWSQVATVLAVALGLDLVIAVMAVAADWERPALLVMTPFLRLAWRPIQLWVIIRSARRFIRGDAEAWRKIRRYGSVSLVEHGGQVG